MRTGLALEHHWWGYTFAVTLEPSSVYKNHKIYAYWLYDFFISLHLFYFWWPNSHKPSETLQFMALPCNWRFNSWFDWQIRHSCGVWQWQVLFSIGLPNFRKFCMSKHSCTYVIIVPWNNIKNDYYSLFFLCREGSGESVHLHRLTWIFVLVLKYHVLAQIMIYVPFIITVNAMVRLHQQSRTFCVTISA